MQFIKTNTQGILLCFALALPSAYLGQTFPVIGGPVFAIFLGMLLTLFVKDKGSAKAGISFTAKKILQLAIVLLGFGLNLSEILMYGKQSLPIIISTIATALLVAYMFYKVLQVPGNISVLVGVGSSICGGSAIAATAPVISANDEEIAQAISVIFLFNIIAAVAFPILGNSLGMSNEGFGIFAGTAINDTSSVTAAATVWDGLHKSNTLDTATVVKLTRTLAIIPITFVLGFVYARKAAQKGQVMDKANVINLFPFFILAFLLASIITTIFQLPTSITAPLKDLSKFFIIMAMAAIGLNTDILKLIKTGGKPIMMGFSCWLAIILMSLFMQHLLNFW